MLDEVKCFLSSISILYIVVVISDMALFSSLYVFSLLHARFAFILPLSECSSDKALQKSIIHSEVLHSRLFDLPSVVWVTSKVRQARKQMGSRLRYHHGLWLVVIGHVPVWLGWWDRVRRTESEGPAVWFWLHWGLTGAAGLLHSVPIIHVRTWLAILHGTALCVLHQLLLTVACQGYSNEEGMQSG